MTGETIKKVVALTIEQGHKVDEIIQMAIEHNWSTTQVHEVVKTKLGIALNYDVIQRRANRVFNIKLIEHIDNRQEQRVSWSEDELQYIIDNFEEMGVRRMSEHLQRSYSSVRNKAFQLQHQGKIINKYKMSTKK